MTTQPAAAARGGVNLGDRATRREQPEIDAGEVELGEVAHLENNLFAERDLLADRVARGECDHLVGGEGAFGKHGEKLAPDIAGGADDGDAIAHGSALPA